MASAAELNGNIRIIFIVGIITTIIVFGLYVNLVIKERAYLKYPTIQFCNLRSAFLLPGFCILNVLAIYFTNHAILGIIEALESLLEAISIFYFFRMLELYSLNHVVGVVNMIGSVPYHLIWNNDTKSCHRDHTLFCYRSIRINILNFLIVRPIFTLIAGLTKYKTIYVLFSVLQIITLVFAMVSLLRFYISVNDYVAHLHPAKKITVIKLYILLIVFQNFAVKKWTEANGGGNNHKYYSFVVIIESFLVSCFFGTVFNMNELAVEDGLGAVEDTGKTNISDPSRSSDSSSKANNTNPTNEESNDGSARKESKDIETNGEVELQNGQENSMNINFINGEKARIEAIKNMSTLQYICEVFTPYSSDLLIEYGSPFKAIVVPRTGGGVEFRPIVTGPS